MYNQHPLYRQTDSTQYMAFPIHYIRIDPPYRRPCTYVCVYVSIYPSTIYFSIIHPFIHPHERVNRMSVRAMYARIPFFLPDKTHPAPTYMCVSHSLAHVRTYMHACSSVCVRAHQHTSLCAPECVHARGLISSIRKCGCSCVPGCSVSSISEVLPWLFACLSVCL